MDFQETYYQTKVRKYIENDLGKKIWIPVSGDYDLFGTKAAYWCGFARKEIIEKVFDDCSWDISIDAGTPGFIIDANGISYKSKLVEEGLEPLLFYRDFYGVAQDYVEVSQEFILLNNLRYDSQNKKYIAMYESGESEEAIRYVDDCTIEIKRKFLKKFAAAKQLVIIIFFDIRAKKSGTLLEFGLEEFDEKESGKDFCYSINGGQHTIPDMVCSRLLGKKIEWPEPIEECGFWPYESETIYQEYIVGSDTNGNPVSYTCNPKKLNNYFGANPEAPWYLTPVFFEREVLQKYYQKPELYNITDGQLSCRNLWGIEIDNHHKDVVAVFLGDLGSHLPESEQLHWKSYNILSDEQLSEVSFKRDMLCMFADSNVVEHQFKRDYKKLLVRWNECYGWSLYLPLTKDDAYIFDQIRRPLNNNQIEFDQLVLYISKLLIDSLNERDILAEIECDKEIKGIAKLQKWFEKQNAFGFEEHITFLRDLWELRSSSVGHRKGKKYEKISRKFQMDKKSLSDIFDEIIQKADDYLQYMINNFT